MPTAIREIVFLRGKLTAPMLRLRCYQCGGEGGDAYPSSPMGGGEGVSWNRESCSRCDGSGWDELPLCPEPTCYLPTQDEAEGYEYSGPFCGGLHGED